MALWGWRHCLGRVLLLLLGFRVEAKEGKEGKQKRKGKWILILGLSFRIG